MDELNTPMVMPPEESIPDWYDGKRINEVLFCQQFLKKHPMKCVRGRLFTVDGLIEDEAQIGNLILEEISGCLTSGLSKVVANLLASIKLQAYSPPLPIETDRIHVANGTLFLDGRFTEDKSYCNNRLSVAYLPDAPPPVRWLQFLSELLVPEDIPTLQEYMGYCLLPTTKGQKMLLMIGKGGEGKSRIGLVMRSMLGDNMNTTSIYTTTLRLNLENEADRRAWEHLQSLDRREYRSVSKAVVSAVNAYFDRSKQLADDPYLETREKEDAFLSRIEDTISRSLQSCTPVSLGGILQLMQSAQPAAALVSEETEEDISAALDFADGF